VSVGLLDCGERNERIKFNAYVGVIKSCSVDSSTVVEFGKSVKEEVVKHILFRTETTEMIK